MFSLISTTQHNQDTVKVWRRGNTIATLTCFGNGVTMVSIKNGSRHTLHTIAGCCDSNNMATLLAHFAKGIS